MTEPNYLEVYKEKASAFDKVIYLIFSLVCSFYAHAFYLQPIEVDYDDYSPSLGLSAAMSQVCEDKKTLHEENRSATHDAQLFLLLALVPLNIVVVYLFFVMKKSRDRITYFDEELPDNASTFKLAESMFACVLAPISLLVIFLLAYATGALGLGADCPNVYNEIVRELNDHHDNLSVAAFMISCLPLTLCLSYIAWQRGNWLACSSSALIASLYIGLLGGLIMQIFGN